MMLEGTKGRRERRAYAIRGYVGANGHGKTLAAVHDLLPDLDAGRPVLSTARLLDFRDPRQCEDDGCVWPGHPDHGQAHPGWVPFLDWGQLLTFTDGAVMMDEVAGVASSRESGALPFQVARELQKLRKRNVSLSYTAPAWGRADKIIRECTQLLTLCKGKMPLKHEGDDETLWRVRRLFVWTSYDAQEFEAFSQAKASATGADGKANLRPLVRSRYWRPGNTAQGAYDTYDSVLSLGWANESGYCMTCGGRRAVPRCSCGESHREETHTARARGGVARTRASAASGPNDDLGHG